MINFRILAIFNWKTTENQQFPFAQKNAGEPQIIVHKIRTALCEKTSEPIFESRYIGLQHML